MADSQTLTNNVQLYITRYTAVRDYSHAAAVTLRGHVTNTCPDAENRARRHKGSDQRRRQGKEFQPKYFKGDRRMEPPPPRGATLHNGVTCRWSDGGREDH